MLAEDQQASGIEQINQALLQMDQVTQQNAALVEEAAAAAHSMHEQSRNLAQTVSVFRLADRQDAAGAALPPAAPSPLPAAIALRARQPRIAPAGGTNESLALTASR
jgi:methyl-accepting chemotaxis protein